MTMIAGPCAICYQPIWRCACPEIRYFAEIANLWRDRDEARRWRVEHEKCAENWERVALEVANRENKLHEEKDATIAALRSEVAILKDVIVLDGRLLAERRRILDAAPCPRHGPCVPHVLEEFARLRAVVAAAAGLIRRTSVDRATMRGSTIVKYGHETDEEAIQKARMAFITLEDALTALRPGVGH